jgi:[ribosomal protein S5]-alanine N-acetyltransferase
MTIRIRPLAEGDRSAFLDAAHASRELHQRWTTPPVTDLAFDAYLARAAGETMACLLVVGERDDDLVGVYNLSEIVRGSFQNAYLGYYAFVPHDGTGAMRAAMPLVTAHAFDELGLHRLQANVQPENTRSRRLLEATGWREEGLARHYLLIDGAWRDHVMYAFTAEDVARHRA